MKRDDYIDIGLTKMIDIDFSLSYPSSSFFVSVNMMVELSSTG